MLALRCCARPGQPASPVAAECASFTAAARRIFALLWQTNMPDNPRPTSAAEMQVRRMEKHMIVWKNWCEKRIVCQGWFLFGIIPLYIKRYNVDCPALRLYRKANEYDD